jgi:hypothetical protein
MATDPGDGPTDESMDASQSVTGRAAEAANQLTELLRAQPAAASAIVASAIGGAIGVWLASRRPSTGGALGGQAAGVVERAQKGGKRLGKAAEYGQLIPLAMKLLENPVVRGLIIQAITRSLSKRFR